LQHGKTGIPASSAYMHLGARYSDQGETTKAIAYYTKSIEASKIPNAYAIYWRGELYYQQEVWHKALGNFERAAAIGLLSPEYEQAQEYLRELHARRS
jgi:tetratricopeptide (TPR) repeat protein